MNGQHTTNIFVGTAGTFAAIALKDWEAVASIIAGAATAAYMVSATFFLWRKSFKARKDDSAGS